MRSLMKTEKDKRVAIASRHNRKCSVTTRLAVLGLHVLSVNWKAEWFIEIQQHRYNNAFNMHYVKRFD